MFTHDLSPSARRDGGAGFTVTEGVVVVVILAIIVAIVVFAVKGSGGSGKHPPKITDAATITAAEKTYCAQNQRYGTLDELVKAGLLSTKSSTTAIALVSGGTCGPSSGSASGFMLGYSQPNGGNPASIPQLRLQASSGFGYPEPFGWLRGPGYANVNYMFDPLVWRDATGNAVPWLASSWTKSADGLSWTFTLRKGVKWSDGMPLTPDDVAFTFTYQNSGPANSKLNQGFYKSYFTYIKSVTANDAANTVTFNLKQAFSTFMDNIGEEMVIIPQHIWQSVTDPFGTPPSIVPSSPPPASYYVGTGPYTLANPTSYNASTGVAEFDANPNFFLGEPYVKKLLFVNSTNTTTDLLNGNIDAASPGSNEFVTTADLAPLASLPSIKNFGGWNRSIEFNFYAGFPYNNVQFRQAIAFAINRQDLITRDLSGNAQVPSMGTLSPSSPYLAPNLPTYSFSDSMANSLLDAIGLKAPASCATAGPSCLRTLPDGSPFTMQIRTTSKFDTTDLDPVLTQYFNAVGLNVNFTIDANDNNATAGNYSMMIEGWGDITADPDNLRTRLADAYTDVLTPGCTPTANHSGCYANGSFTNVYGWNPTNDTGGTDHSGDFMLKAGYCGSGDNAGPLGPGPLPCDASNPGELTTTSASQRLSDLQAMQVDVAKDVPEIQLYVPTAILYYQPGTLSAWYYTPGGTPPGPPTFFNKEVFVTGTQFGLPSAYAAPGGPD
jgi:peptide/nickel transport system substrate-binding protein